MSPFLIWGRVYRNPGESLNLQSVLSGKRIDYHGGIASIREYLLAALGHEAWFDNFRKTARLLQELKGNYDFAMEPWFWGNTNRVNTLVNGIQNQAQTQLFLAKHYKLHLEWLVRKDNYGVFEYALDPFKNNIILTPY